MILVRAGLWNSPPVDTFYFTFAFGLYLDVRVELRELRKEFRIAGLSLNPNSQPSTPQLTNSTSPVNRSGLIPCS
jgi:hypothetical protein